MPTGSSRIRTWLVKFIFHRDNHCTTVPSCKGSQFFCVQNADNLLVGFWYLKYWSGLTHCEHLSAISTIVARLDILINTPRIILKAIFAPFVTLALLIMKLVYLNNFSLMHIAPKTILWRTNRQVLYYTVLSISWSRQEKLHQIVVGHDPVGR